MQIAQGLLSVKQKGKYPKLRKLSKNVTGNDILPLLTTYLTNITKLNSICPAALKKALSNKILHTLIAHGLLSINMVKIAKFAKIVKNLGISTTLTLRLTYHSMYNYHMNKKCSQPFAVTTEQYILKTLIHHYNNNHYLIKRKVILLAYI